VVTVPNFEVISDKQIHSFQEHDDDDDDTSNNNNLKYIYNCKQKQGKKLT
jgi:hypothetical protein